MSDTGREAPSQEYIDAFKKGAAPLADVWRKAKTVLTPQQEATLRAEVLRKGQEATQAWQQTHNLEDTRISMLRTLAGDAIQFSPVNRQLLLKRNERNERIVAQMEVQLKQLGMAKTDRIIADQTTIPIKLRRIQDLPVLLNSGLTHALDGRTPDKIVAILSEDRGQGAMSSADIATLLEGYFIAEVFSGSSVNAINALAQIGILENRGGGIRDYVTVLNDLRANEPTINVGATFLAREGPVIKRRLDGAMELHGWFWSPAAGYINMGNPVPVAGGGFRPPETAPTPPRTGGGFQPPSSK